MNKPQKGRRQNKWYWQAERINRRRKKRFRKQESEKQEKQGEKTPGGQLPSYIARHGERRKERYSEQRNIKA